MTKIITGKARPLRIWTRFENSRGRDCVVKITLMDGEPFRLYRAHDTDEGFSYRELSYCLDYVDGAVHLVFNTGGCDCDGPIDHYNKLIAPISGLIAENSPDNPWACFEVEKQETYDHNAIAAGY